MTAPAAFKATFSDFRLVKGRKVAQIVVEVPIEEADNALKALGGIPRPDIERWVAVARLSPVASIPESAAIAGADDAGASPQKQPAAATGETKERRPFHTLPLPQQVALRCADEAFREWIAMMEGVQSEVVDDAFAAAWVREKCDVHSRSEIKPGSLAAIAWGKLEARFLQDIGRMPAEIGQ